MDIDSQTGQGDISMDVSYSSVAAGSDVVDSTMDVDDYVRVEEPMAAAAPDETTQSDETVPYTVCYAYDKVKERDYAKFLETFRTYMEDDNDFIFSKECFNNDPEKDNRYMVVIRKNINDKLSENEEFTAESGILLKRYRSRPFHLNSNFYHGFFVKTDKIGSQKIYDLFKYLEEKGFIHPNTYQFHYPQPYPGGGSRKYVAITFENKENKVPRSFISKLRNLLNDTEFNNGEKLKISWLQKSVFDDMKRKRVKTVFKGDTKKPTESSEKRSVFKAADVVKQL